MVAIPSHEQCLSRRKTSPSQVLYYTYRYYNASLGRWTNRDPIGERVGASRYAFVANAPVGLIDGDGRTIVLVPIVIIPPGYLPPEMSLPPRDPGVPHWRDHLGPGWGGINCCVDQGDYLRRAYPVVQETLDAFDSRVAHYLELAACDDPPPDPSLEAIPQILRSQSVRLPICGFSDYSPWQEGFWRRHPLDGPYIGNATMSIEYVLVEWRREGQWVSWKYDASVLFVDGMGFDPTWGDSLGWLLWGWYEGGLFENRDACRARWRLKGEGKKCCPKE